MRRIIYKYPIRVGPSLMKLPADAEILTIQEQDGVPVLWASIPIADGAVSPGSAMEERVIDIVGTGMSYDEHPGTNRYNYLATFQLPQLAFVGHVFEVVEVKSSELH